jgi:hypothetical protein
MIGWINHRLPTADDGDLHGMVRWDRNSLGCCADGMRCVRGKCGRIRLHGLLIRK